jgi:hypothetical protein
MPSSLSEAEKLKNRTRVLFKVLQDALGRYLIFLKLQEADILTAESERLDLRQLQEASLIREITGLDRALQPLLTALHFSDPDGQQGPDRTDTEWAAARKKTAELRTLALAAQEHNRNLASARLVVLAERIKQNRAAFARLVRRPEASGEGASVLNLTV